LDVIERNPSFAPTAWGLSERSKEPYSREAIWERLFSDGEQPFSQTRLYLHRNKAPKYSASLSLGDRPRVAFELDPKLTEARREEVFRFGDDLAANFRPDIGITHIWSRAVPEQGDERAWAVDDARDAELLFSSALLAPVDYFDTGPSGFGMRTYLGPHYVEQFGRERIESLPLVVTKQGWGGYRVDLVAERWKADVATLLAAWRAGMSHVKEAGVFAEPIVRNGRLVGYTKGERSVIGGEVAG
jgi:hypothetical protein